MTFLLTLLGAMLCSLTVFSEVVPQAGFNLEKMIGKWYLVGLATNADWFMNHHYNVKVGTTRLTITSDGDLEIDYAIVNTHGICQRINHLAKKADVPGKFTYTSWEKMNDLRFVEVSYDNYAMTYTTRTRKGTKPNIVTKLYGRTADVNPDLQEKFKQFSLGVGILPESIAFLSKNRECQEA